MPRSSPGLEHELVRACAMRRALDLGDHRRAPVHLGPVDDPRAELRADDAEVAELGHVEQRHPRRRRAAAGRAVDLAVREHRDVALHGRRAVLLVLPEDDAVDAAELRLQRMDDLVVRARGRP